MQRVPLHLLQLTRRRPGLASPCHKDQRPSENEKNQLGAGRAEGTHVAEQEARYLLALRKGLSVTTSLPVSPTVGTAHRDITAGLIA